MRWFLRRCHRDLDARVADARGKADDAGSEERRSRARYEQVRRQVVDPLHEAASRNQFADVLRRSLIEGHRGRA